MPTLETKKFFAPDIGKLEKTDLESEKKQEQKRTYADAREFSKSLEPFIKKVEDLATEAEQETEDKLLKTEQEYQISAPAETVAKLTEFQQEMIALKDQTIHEMQELSAEARAEQAYEEIGNIITQIENIKRRAIAKPESVLTLGYNPKKDHQIREKRNHFFGEFQKQMEELRTPQETDEGNKTKVEPEYLIGDLGELMDGIVTQEALENINIQHQELQKSIEQLREKNAKLHQILDNIEPEYLQLIKGGLTSKEEQKMRDRLVKRGAFPEDQKIRQWQIEQDILHLPHQMKVNTELLQREENYLEYLNSFLDQRSQIDKLIKEGVIMETEIDELDQIMQKTHKELEKMIPEELKNITDEEIKQFMEDLEHLKPTEGVFQAVLMKELNRLLDEKLRYGHGDARWKKAVFKTIKTVAKTLGLLAGLATVAQHFYSGVAHAGGGHQAPVHHAPNIGHNVSDASHAVAGDVSHTAPVVDASHHDQVDTVHHNVGSAQHADTGGHDSGDKIKLEHTKELLEEEKEDYNDLFIPKEILDMHYFLKRGAQQKFV